MIPHESSRLPCEPETMGAWARAALLLIVCIAALWFAVFVTLCVLLSRTNTESVRVGCAGLWDCMLVAPLAPPGH